MLADLEDISSTADYSMRDEFFFDQRQNPADIYVIHEARAVAAVQFVCCLFVAAHSVDFI
jgi:hypothetical protein